MSAHVLLNLLNKFEKNDQMHGLLRKEMKCEAFQALIYLFLATSLINSIIQVHWC